MFCKLFDNYFTIVVTFLDILRSFLSSFGLHFELLGLLGHPRGPQGVPRCPRLIQIRSKWSILGSFLDPFSMIFSYFFSLETNTDSGPHFIDFGAFRGCPTSQKACIYCLKSTFFIFQLFSSRADFGAQKLSK